MKITILKFIIQLIIVFITQVILILLGYSLTNPIIWIACGILILNSWYFDRNWMRVWFQMLMIVLWATLLLYFHIESSAFSVIFISNIIVSLLNFLY